MMATAEKFLEVIGNPDDPSGVVRLSCAWIAVGLPLPQHTAGWGSVTRFLTDAEEYRWVLPNGPRSSLLPGDIACLAPDPDSEADRVGVVVAPTMDPETFVSLEGDDTYVRSRRHVRMFVRPPWEQPPVLVAPAAAAPLSPLPEGWT